MFHSQYPAELTAFFDGLWQDYITVAPLAARIVKLFAAEGESVINDHVAFRTMSHSAIRLSVLESILTGLGYEPYDYFIFEQKKLQAKAYRHARLPDAPKVFLSELQCEELPDSARELLYSRAAEIPDQGIEDQRVFWRGPMWTALDEQEYAALGQISEYAAWLLTMGLRVNHFTVSVNHLQRWANLQQLNGWLKSNGIALNDTGGEIKGNREVLLEQSATMADWGWYRFSSGKQAKLPTCFYEFALRYKGRDGVLFDSFVEGNANTIFTSTDHRRR